MHLRCCERIFEQRYLLFINSIEHKCVVLHIQIMCSFVSPLCTILTSLNSNDKADQTAK